jgi:hypothetical protein
MTPGRYISSRKLWNPNEMIPLLIRNASVTHALPDRISRGGGGDCEWVEVGVVAKSVVNMCHFDKRDEKEDGFSVYNITHPKSFSWEWEFLPALEKTRVDFKKVGYMDWQNTLRDTDTDLTKNPSRKLLAFWEAQAEAAGGLAAQRDLSSSILHQLLRLARP